jgi:hypothetical protein
MASAAAQTHTRRFGIVLAGGGAPCPRPGDPAPAACRADAAWSLTLAAARLPRAFTSDLARSPALAPVASLLDGGVG